VIGDVRLGTVANGVQIRRGLIVGLACAELEAVERTESEPVVGIVEGVDLDDGGVVLVVIVRGELEVFSGGVRAGGIHEDR
jgi:hypothetical protein